MRKLLVSSGMILLSMLCFAAPLTVEEAIDAAKGYDADYALAMKQYTDAVSITNRESSFTPSLSLTGSIGTGAGFFSKADGWDSSWDGLTGSVGISTSFTFAGSSINEKKTKNISNESSLLKLETSEDDLETSVINGYFSIAQARDSIELSENSLEQARTQLQSVQERYDAGLASELDLVQAENSVSTAEYGLQSLKSQYTLLLMSFKNLTGLDLTDIELMDVSSFEIKELLSSEELFNRYAYSSPTIKQLDLAARSAELSYSTTKLGSIVPSLSLSAGYTINGGYQTPSMMGGRSDTLSDSLSVSARVSIPLDAYLPSSSTAGSIAKAKNSAQDARTQLSNALVDFKYSLESTCQSIGLSAVQIDNQEKVLAALEKQYGLTENAYYAGEIDLSSLQTIENNVLSARSSLLNLKYTYIKSLYTLSQTLGVSYTDLLKG